MEAEAKLKEFIAALSKVAPDREGGSERKSKTNVLPPFPTCSRGHI